jgi:hypothetical protein
MLIDELLPKLEESMEHSKGKIRADVVHDKLVALAKLTSLRNAEHGVVHRRTGWRTARRPWHPDLNVTSS